MHFFPETEEELLSLRFKTDPHWNRKGHEVAAKAIVNVLTEHEFI